MKYWFHQSIQIHHRGSWEHIRVLLIRLFPFNAITQKNKASPWPLVIGYWQRYKSSYCATIWAYSLQIGYIINSIRQVTGMYNFGDDIRIFHSALTLIHGLTHFSKQTHKLFVFLKRDYATRHNLLVQFLSATCTPVPWLPPHDSWSLPRVFTLQIATHFSVNNSYGGQRDSMWQRNKSIFYVRVECKVRRDPETALNCSSMLITSLPRCLKHASNNKSPPSAAKLAQSRLGSVSTATLAQW